jgi:4-nitrophenyl phosphatase
VTPTDVDLDGLVCDLDGVLYRGDVAVPGAAAAIAELRARGVRIVFCTNNSRNTVAQYQHKLATMEVDVAPGEILTSAVVTGEYLAETGGAGATAIVVGGDGLRESVGAAGLEIVDSPAVARAEVVVVGYDTSFTYDAMRRASLALRDGAAFIATNVDATFPAPGGALWPGAGAIVASLVTASEREPIVMGKPRAPMMDAAEKRLHGARRVAILGDRPDTDLAGGVAKGWTKILVTSGVTAPGEESSLDPPPDLVLGSIADLVG